MFLFIAKNLEFSVFQGITEDILNYNFIDINKVLNIANLDLLTEPFFYNFSVLYFYLGNKNTNYIEKKYFYTSINNCVSKETNENSSLYGVDKYTKEEIMDIFLKDLTIVKSAPKKILQIVIHLIIYKIIKILD